MATLARYGPPRRRRLSVLGPVILAVVGVGLLAVPTFERVRGEWQQHDIATAADAQLPRYGRALEAAYGTIYSDFEDAIVAFEVGVPPPGVPALPAVASTTGVGATAGTAPAPEPAAAPPAGVGDTAEPAAPVEAPATFEAVRIRIPKISVDQAVVEGVSRDHLKIGPGHYPGTGYPGRTGNVVISGHRTTYTRPFYDVDLLDVGDVIIVDTPEGSYRYLVTTSFVVDPSDLSPIAPTDAATLTLTTCNPKGSAIQRLIIQARLDGEPAA